MNISAQESEKHVSNYKFDFTIMFSVSKNNEAFDLYTCYIYLQPYDINLYANDITVTCYVSHYLLYSNNCNNKFYASLL